MQPRQILDDGLLLSTLNWEMSPVRKGNGGTQKVLELIQYCIKEGRIDELMTALQQPYEIYFTYRYHCEDYNRDATLTYTGNFYQRAISDHLREHLALLKENNLIIDNKLSSKWQISPLVAAVRSRNYTVAEDLLLTGNVNECDIHTNQSLLEIALEFVNTEIVNSLFFYDQIPKPIILSKFQPYPDTTDDEKSKRVEFIKFLINHGANVLLPSIKEYIQNESRFANLNKELFTLLDSEIKGRTCFKDNLFLLFKERKNNNSVVQDVPDEIFRSIYHSTWNG